MTSMLTFLNVTFLVILALVILKAVHAARSQGSSQSDASFWLSRRDVKDDMLADPNLVTIVAALHDAKALVREALLLTPSMRSFNELDEVLRRLEVCYSHAIETKHYLSVGSNALLIESSERCLLMTSMLCVRINSETQCSWSAMCLSMRPLPTRFTAVASRKTNSGNSAASVGGSARIVS